LEQDARLIAPPATDVLAQGLRTPDIMAPGCTRAGTEEMGSAVLRALDKRAA
jgi:3-isopropylmalate dehydrogenase